MQLSLLGWPPLLSHGLAFVLGTLLLQSGGPRLNLPTGKILIPLSRFARVDTETKTLLPQQKMRVLSRESETWCRGAGEDISLWRPPGKSADTFVLWPMALAWLPRLEQALQKKLALTTESEKFGFCRGDGEAHAGRPSTGIIYD